MYCMSDNVNRHQSLSGKEQTLKTSSRLLGCSVDPYTQQKSTGGTSLRKLVSSFFFLSSIICFSLEKNGKILEEDKLQQFQLHFSIPSRDFSPRKPRKFGSGSTLLRGISSNGCNAFQIWDFPT